MYSAYFPVKYYVTDVNEYIGRLNEKCLRITEEKENDLNSHNWLGPNVIGFTALTAVGLVGPIR